MGFLVVQRVAAEAGIKISKNGFSSFWNKGEVEGQPVLFLLPQTFMNRSGEAVKEAKEYYRLEEGDLMVVHDDLDLPLGKVKLDFDAGAAGHRGVASVAEELGSKKFHRIRIGIGRPARKEEVEGFVLSPFQEDELEVMEKMVEEAAGILKKWI